MLDGRTLTVPADVQTVPIASTARARPAGGATMPDHAVDTHGGEPGMLVQLLAHNRQIQVDD